MTASDSTEKFTEQKVLEIKRWASEGLLSIRTTRDARFSFVPGQFARIGLHQNPADARTSEPPNLWRAYSMVSHPRENYLEFLSVTVPDGLFSPRLATLVPGDSLWVQKAPFGFLTLEKFEPAKVLWLVATGTGLSAYLPILQDDQTWQNFESVVLVHGVRTQNELAYRDELLALSTVKPSFVYLPITSRESWANAQQMPARITEAYREGLLQTMTGLPLNPEEARIMLCGNPAMVTEMRAMLSDAGFAASRRGQPGTLAVENYW
jgi:ferredoxin/flavodoxin---NADP+ reductase